MQTLLPLGDRAALEWQQKSPYRPQHMLQACLAHAASACLHTALVLDNHTWILMCCNGHHFMDILSNKFQG